MNKKDEFKDFAKTRPELVEFIKDGSMSWQSFYELYDIYGGDDTVWSKYSVPKQDASKNKLSFTGINDLVKKVDMNSVQKHIGTAQKAIGLFKEFGVKNTETAAKTIGNLGSSPSIPRPINKFFGD